LRFVSGTIGQGLFACHEQRFFFRLFLVALAGNVVLNVFLDGRFGAVGAGISLVCTELAGLTIASWRLGKRCGYRTPVNFLIRLLVPTAASAAVVLLLSGQHVVFILAAAAATYLAVNMVAGPVNWSILTSLFRKKVTA
jgi:O-antigen/teichoic acid export membrane protein